MVSLSATASTSFTGELETTWLDTETVDAEVLSL